MNKKQTFEKLRKTIDNLSHKKAQPIITVPIANHKLSQPTEHEVALYFGDYGMDAN